MLFCAVVCCAVLCGAMRFGEGMRVGLVGRGIVNGESVASICDTFCGGFVTVVGSNNTRSDDVTAS